MTSKRYLIIADDFTGANDTGVQLKRRGLETFVTLEELTTGSGCLVLDTESRGLSEEEAGDKMEHMLQKIDFSRYDYMIKKVDSTLRGNVAIETARIDGLYKSEFVIFMPALPDLGRTTINGIHQLYGVPITQTEFAHDLQTPVQEDNITKLLQSAYKEQVRHIGLEEIRQRRMDLSAGRVFTFDAVTNQDMRTTIEIVRKTGKRTLWVGTAALADNLLEAESPSLPSLGVVASLSSITKGQVEYAKKSGVSIVSVPTDALIQHPEEKRISIDEAVSLLSKKRDTIICVASLLDEAAGQSVKDAAAQRNLTETQTSRVIQDIVGDITCGIIDRAKISGVFLTGGDTAIGFFQKAQAMGSRILAEVATGIPMMILRGGRFDGLKVITKAGAFGKEDSIVYSLRKLKEIM